MQQAQDASAQVSVASVTAEVEALAAARSRIDEAAPSIVVAITEFVGHPQVSESSFGVPVPHPPVAPSREDVIVPWADWHSDVYFVISGTLYNDGTSSARVYCNGPKFYEGKHPLTGEPLGEPPVCDPANDARILYPGQFALFQLYARRQIWDCLDAMDADPPRRPHFQTKDLFMFRPGSTDEPMTSATIEVEAEPVVRVEPDGEDVKVGDLTVRVKAGCYMHVSLEHFRDYPDSLNYVHATLRNDEEELRNSYMRKLMLRAYRRERDREQSETKPVEEM
ncbi:hypothetical protein [Micromonospora chersina]|uniref:hypothetical protein n=1 Tax=Micromonospora chersina TaxID=47854 RepID=UPI00371A2A59